MENIRPDSRLLAVADAVRGDYLCDVGTDHAILPIYLCQTGKISRAVASDINEGPLLRARKNIELYGLSEKIETVFSDGLEKLGAYSPTDISIAGMGGILITEILSSSDMPHRADLVLQPMRHAHLLREYLCENGYRITAEALSADGERIYQIISARYTGEKYEYSPIELYIGKLNIENRDKYPALFALHLRCLTFMFTEKTKSGDAKAFELLRQAQQLAKGEQNGNG